MGTSEISDQAVGELIDLARSARVYFELVNDRLAVRAVNPEWSIWRPLRHLLDEIGQPRIEAFLREAGPTGPMEAAWPRPREAMSRWAAAMGYRP
ncbi:MAG TPA: hypothetical protein PK286_02290 [Devosia sp.]|nr:hypothetical protein [Devosia sp.]